MRIYQIFISPVLHWVAGPGFGCRFYPSCSQYASEAIKAHGIICGCFLSLRRIGKCRPMGPSGFDPVPESTRKRKAHF